MDALVGAMEAADTTADLGEVIVRRAGDVVGFSGFSFMRLSGPVLSPSRDFFVLNERCPQSRAQELLLEALPLIDRLEPFAAGFAMKRKSFDIGTHYPPDVVRRSEVFNALWRPLGVERQLVGFLGSSERPIGFICAARNQRESPFTQEDLAAFEKLRAAVERSLVARRHLGRGGLDDALVVLSRTVSSAWFLFDAAGNLLWLTEAAVARLSTDAVQIGSHVAVRRSGSFERLQARVRAEARRRGGARSIPTLGGTPPGEELVMRVFETGPGAALFLVGYAEPRPSGASPDARAPATAARAARLAREHALTPRQTEVLAHVASGKPNKTIAADLGCGESTVELHMTALLDKLGCESRAQLVARFWTA